MRAEATGGSSSSSSSSSSVVVLSTAHGDISVRFRPDLSPESVAYVREVAEKGKCAHCSLYRSEGTDILQGIAKTDGIRANTVLGPCPPGAEQGKEEGKEKCPSHDPGCGCHGPVMTRGMVGWAGGGGGPDFFVDTFAEPAVFWRNWHTVWGTVEDEESLAVIGRIHALPKRDQGGMTMLEKDVPFTLSLR